MEAKNNAHFSDYLYILYKWRKFLLINSLIVLILAFIIAFLIPKDYKATASVTIPQDNMMGLGGLSSLVSGKSSAALGAKLFGISNTSEDMILGILNSRTALSSTFNKFNLWKYYEIKDHNMDEAIKSFGNDINFEPNENGLIEISVINENPQLSADIANYFVKIVDSLNIELNIQQARNNRVFIEKRYSQNIYDLKAAEDSLYNFQKKYGIVAVPEQLEVAFRATAEIESEMAKREVAAQFIKEQYGENSPQYQGIAAEAAVLRKKVEELKNADKLSGTSNILFPFKDMPDMSMEYLRKFREVEIQQTIMELVLPMYEQAKVEEQKSIPTILVVDKAVPPQMKYSPKRSFIILLVFMPFLFFFMVISFRGEKIVNMTDYSNPLLEGENKIYLRLKKIYRMKI